MHVFAEGVEVFFNSRCFWLVLSLNNMTIAYTLHNDITPVYILLMKERWDDPYSIIKIQNM